MGAIYLTQIPAYAKEWMYGDETVVTLILAVFSIGIALGSLLCERLSGHKVEIGLVPFGSMGLTIFGLLLWWHSGGFPQNVQANDWLAVLSSGQGWLVLFDILGIGVFGGFYIVPLYALIQSRTPLKERSRVIAANNILNALFMVVSAIVSILLLSVAKLSIPQLFLAVSVMNIAVNIYIFKIVPEFTMRFMIWLLGHSMYRVEHRNLDRIPDEGAALLVCNHVSFVDALLIAGAVRRPIRFVMYYKIYQLPVLNFIFRTAGTIPIAGRNEDMDIYEKSFKRIAQYLAEGELVCIFPEGKLTTDGEINGFKNGMSRIIQKPRYRSFHWHCKAVGQLLQPRPEQDPVSPPLVSRGTGCRFAHCRRRGNPRGRARRSESAERENAVAFTLRTTDVPITSDWHDGQR